MLGLIDRWNASADKPKELLVRLLGAFRPDMESIEKLKGGPVSSVRPAPGYSDPGIALRGNPAIIQFREGPQSHAILGNLGTFR